MIIQSIRKRPLTTLAVTGILISSLYRHQKEQQRQKEESKKKKVLILPFYRMRIVEQKSPVSLASLAESTGGGGSGRNQVIEIQADELVSLIHDAARDPSLVSLYGVFGNGGSVATGGWAHLEEIRNAIQVFATSHRVHMEPGTEKPPLPREKKSLYVYANTLANPMGSTQSMRDYFLASAFTQIYLQPQGELNLFGLHATSTFLREFLYKYGIAVHVWKHGEYKNMANLFTHSHFTKEHYDNVAGILLPIHRHVCDAIYTSRHKHLKKYSDFAKFWSMVENAGSLPARIAQQIGFVDHLPRMNPLDALVKSNKIKPTKESGVQAVNKEELDSDIKPEEESDYGAKDASVSDLASVLSDRLPTALFQDDSIAAKSKFQTDLDDFQADSAILIDAYAKQRVRERQNESTRWKMYQTLRRMYESNSIAACAMTLLGYSAPYFNMSKETFPQQVADGLNEKIAVVKINEAIGEALARKMEKALRRIKEQKDIKCVVLRVDSPGGSINACETIYQQLQDLPQKVVVSFGNISASGGYYISANAARIFASPTTITGSIGVVMLRMDFRDFSKQYGITFDSIPTSSLSGSFDPFYALNSQMNENFLNSADRAYNRFKSLVSDGRNMSINTVESVAKGRLFTGEQAREYGLVDELGGLDRAVAYAQKNYTSSGHAEVVSWPPKKSLMDALIRRAGGEREDFDDVELPNVFHVAIDWLSKSPLFWPLHNGSTALRFAANADATALSLDSLDGKPTLPCPLVTSAVMLTADENTAIRFLMEENSIPNVKLLSSMPHILWDYR